MDNRKNIITSTLFGQPWAILPEALNRLILSASAPAATAATQTPLPQCSGECAVIPIIGPIVPHAGWLDDIFGVISLDVLNRQLAEAMANPQVNRIALYINSPGGQATGIHEFAARIRMANKVKPVTAYVYGMAASAAYWIASAAGKMVAGRTAEVGSIGVVYAWTDDTAARESHGLKDHVLVSSQSPKKYLDPSTQAGRAELQILADSLADIFIDSVAEYRGVSRSRVANKFGKGRIVMAETALAAGMIDEIGIFEAVLAGDIGQAERNTAMALHQYLPNVKANGKPKKQSENDDDDEATREDEEDKTSDAAASTDPSEDDDDEEGKEATASTASNGMTLNAFRAAYPGIFKEACAVGAQNERKRIQSIFGLGAVGHDELVQAAAFGANPMDARDLAYAITLKQKEASANMHSAIRSDAGNAQVVTAPASSAVAGSEVAWEKRILNAMSGDPKGAM